MKRIESLDYLRGLMAFSVMLYHYVSWAYPSQLQGSDRILGRLGIYSVSMFFIVSGLSLTIVYNNKIKTIKDIRYFLIKRVFRIFPLFWLSVTLMIIAYYLSSIILGSEFQISNYQILLNYSLLFGFVDTSAYISTGAWSIGNEMVFYLIFPFIFLTSIKYKYFTLLVFFISFLVYILFAFVILDSSSIISAQWNNYINPFNQLFLFLSGIIIGKYVYLFDKSNKIKKRWILILFILLFLFLFLPANGDLINITTRYNRIIFSLLCVLIVSCVYIINPTFNTTISMILNFLGVCSYSIYLLHPIIAILVLYIARKLEVFDKGGAYLIAGITTLFVSWLSVKYIEKPMIDYAKMYVNKIKIKSESMSIHEK
jgi:peptidoglycan/LPS O-acetylase OafA/YrhL